MTPSPGAGWGSGLREREVGLGVEEVEALDVDGDPGVGPGANSGAGIEPGDERGVPTELVHGIRVAGVDLRRVELEVRQGIRAERFDELDLRVQALIGGVVGAQLCVVEILGSDAGDQRLA